MRKYAVDSKESTAVTLRRVHVNWRLLGMHHPRLRLQAKISPLANTHPPPNPTPTSTAVHQTQTKMAHICFGQNIPRSSFIHSSPEALGIKYTAKIFHAKETNHRSSPCA